MLFIRLSVNHEEDFLILAAHNVGDGSSETCDYNVYEFDAKTGKRQDPALFTVKGHYRPDGGEVLASKVLSEYAKVPDRYRNVGS